MKRFIILSILLSVFFSQTAYSQKVKYKDLFILLNSKKYEEAEPFLRIFIGDPKNEDHANAHLHMAFMFEFKANRNDLLTQNELLVSNIDSAKYYFAIAKEMIDEKEISKNDDFYQSYSRRDLRTGKFGIKLSDVHFDIENRVKALNEQRSSVSKIYYHFVMTEKSYYEADSVFKIVQEKFSNQNSLLLKSESKDLALLSELTSLFDSTRYHFNEYKVNLEKFPESSYDQKIVLNEFSNLEEEAVMPVDWKSDEVVVRNYRDWATKTESLITGEIKKMKEHLVTYNTQLDNLTSKTLTDSASVKNELTSLVDQMLGDDLKKYDSNPLPMAVFNYKVGRIEYFNNIFQDDTSQVFLGEQIPILDKRIEMAEETSKLANLLGGFDLSEEADKYPDFFESVGGNSGLSKIMVDGQREMESEVAKWSTTKTETMARMKWGITELDSVSLVPSEIQGYKYYSLLIQDSIPELKAIVTGLVNSDSSQSFTAVVNQNYEIENLFTFKLDSLIDSLRLSVTPITQIIDKQNMLSGLYVQKADTVVRLNLSLVLNSEVSWTTNLDIPGELSKVNYDPQTEETHIFIKREEEEELVVTLDASGNPIELVKE